MAKPIRANMSLFDPLEFFFPQRMIYFKIKNLRSHISVLQIFHFFKNGSLDKIKLPKFLEKVNQGSFSFNIKKIHQFSFLLLIKYYFGT